MPEYLSPGVYVEETSFRPKTIEGVSTSTAGFVGPTRTGPTSGEPRLLTSFADFRRIYGGLEDLEFEKKEGGTLKRKNYLAYAVRAFFEEGGQRCYVARVFDKLASGEGKTDDGKAKNGGARGKKGKVTVSARYPGRISNMKVIFRPLASRDVSQVDRANEDNSADRTLPGLSLGDTVFAIPGEALKKEEGGAGINFYDYVLDDESGDRVLRHDEDKSVKAKKLTSTDKVFPLRTRVLVQRERKRPGGGIEYGPEKEVGVFDLHPDSGEPLSEALRKEDPVGDPLAKPIIVDKLENEDGEQVETGVGYATELFSNPTTDEVLLPVKVKDLKNIKAYDVTLPFNESELTITSVSKEGETLTPKPREDTTFRRSGIHVSKKIKDTPLSGGKLLLKVVIKRQKKLDAEETLPIQNFKLLDENGRDISGDLELSLTDEEPDITGDITEPDDDGQNIEIKLDSDISSDKIYSYKFNLSFDAWEVDVGIKTDHETLTSSDEVQVTTNQIQVRAENLDPPLNSSKDEYEALLNLNAQLLKPGLESPSLKNFKVKKDEEDADWEEAIGRARVNLSVEIGDLAEVPIRLKGGNDGREPTSYVTDQGENGPPDKPQGFDALEDLENVSIVAAPGYTEISDESAALTVQDQLITHCTDMKYRIAVLDTPSGSSVKEARDWRGNIDSKYAAMYHPWITIYDPRTRSELNLPPSGHVAGIYARNDIENGVHKAPANEVVRSAVGFETRINKAQQDVLNPEAVNCFRFFEGRGNRLWGARMATSDNEYKYVNIRRYLAYLERSIDEGTQVFVFENNGTDLWRNVRRTIGSFLKNEWRSDRLMGTTPEEAYFVKCDRSTMTQNDIDNGRLICEIGVALFRPAEFVIFRIGQKLLSDTG